MTTITIINDCNLPQTEFSTISELRNVLNFLTLNFEEVPKNEVSDRLTKKYEETKNHSLSDFNYLTDESQGATNCKMIVQSKRFTIFE